MKRHIRVVIQYLILLLALNQVILAKAPALHPLFPLLDGQGENVLKSKGPVSTMQTCGSCHDTEYITSHSGHSDAGLSKISTFEAGELDYPWDKGPGYFGKWNPINYQQVSPDRPTIDPAAWIKAAGFRHVGGGPAEKDMNGNRLDEKAPQGRGWDYQRSGVVEMNCFLCHISNPDNATRLQTLESGQFAWANSATLAKSKVIDVKETSHTWNSEAFNDLGQVKREYLTPVDPANANCGQCHGLVFTANDAPRGLNSCDWNTATRGEIIAPQRIYRTGLNLKDKESLTRSWDIHAERAVQCVDCHPSSNNPIYYRDTQGTQLPHLIFDARRIDVVDYLYRPSHEFASGSAKGVHHEQTMRSCESCHDASVGHTWLPYKDAHFDKVSCESCHIPRMHGPAYEQIDWTVLTAPGTSAHDCRGADGDPRNINTLIEGFEPILLPGKDTEGRIKLGPYNLVSSWYWVAGDPALPVAIDKLNTAFFTDEAYRQDIIDLLDDDGDGQLQESELRLDTSAKTDQVRKNLEALGLTQVSIQADVQAYKINHDVANGRWANQSCETCHGDQSRIGASFELASFIPGDVLPVAKGRLNITQFGSMETDAQGRLSYHFEPAAQALYVFGTSRVIWVDWLGILILLGTLTGISVHATLRLLAARNGQLKAHATKRVYMYSFYERLWHWVQVMAIFLLLFTGLIIHKPELLGVLAFPYMVQVHNVLGFVLFGNAFLAVFYHLVSGEIKQYIPQPRGFFDQAVLQAGFYLKGIFKGEKHPFEKTPAKKLNPLQQITYFGLLNFLLPLQIITGLLIWSMQVWPRFAEDLGGLPLLGPIHAMLAWLFATFIILHMYLTTTGHKPLDGIRAMINGWDEVEDNEAGHADPPTGNMRKP